MGLDRVSVALPAINYTIREWTIGFVPVDSIAIAIEWCHCQRYHLAIERVEISQTRELSPGQHAQDPNVP